MSASPSGPTTKQEIIDLERRWAAAIQRQDRAAMEQILAGEFIFVAGVRGQPLEIVSRAPLLESLPTYKVESFSIDDIRVNVYGDLAVVLMLYTQTATSRGLDRSAQFLITDICIRTAGGWRVAERHSSRPEQPAAAQPH